MQPVVAGDAFYDFESPAGSEVAQVLACVLDGVPLTPLSTVALYEQLPTWQTCPAQSNFSPNRAPPPCSWPPCQTVAKQQGRPTQFADLQLVATFNEAQDELK